MRRNLLLVAALIFVLAIFASSMASAIDVYTFKKDRVDQELSGNQGYLSGAPQGPAEERKSKRTLIGVDIELPWASSASTEKDAKTEEPKEKPAPKPVKKVESPEKPKPLPKQDTWIK